MLSEEEGEPWTRIDEANSHNDTRSRNFEAAKLSDFEG